MGFKQSDNFCNYYKNDAKNRLLGHNWSVFLASNRPLMEAAGTLFAICVMEALFAENVK